MIKKSEVELVVIRGVYEILGAKTYQEANAISFDLHRFCDTFSLDEIYRSLIIRAERSMATLK